MVDNSRTVRKRNQFFKELMRKFSPFNSYVRTGASARGNGKHYLSHLTYSSFASFLFRDYRVTKLGTLVPSTGPFDVVNSLNTEDAEILSNLGFNVVC